MTKTKARNPHSPLWSNLLQMCMSKFYLQRQVYIVGVYETMAYIFILRKLYENEILKKDPLLESKAIESVITH